MPAIDWTPELEQQICDDIESGLTLRAVAEKNRISKSLILKKAKESSTFRDQYARAMDVRNDSDCDALADQILEKPALTEHGVDSGWVAWQRVRVDTMKWLLSKRNPKKYGDKVEHSGEIALKRVVSDL